MKRWLYAKLLFFKEVTSNLDERSSNVYLTDGGHIENLGVYPLLLRGCRLIIAIDAEADPEYSFSSLTKMERYARIDLGIRIDLPWRDIAAASRKVDKTLASEPFDTGLATNKGPHVAVGRIYYADGANGVLVYVKASMSGDERDYILDYKRRFAAFPHETTGDQFFTEEQLEAYRALGFHVLSRASAMDSQP